MHTSPTFFLLKGEDHPMCISCQCIITVKQPLIECKSFNQFRKKYWYIWIYVSLDDIFEQISLDSIFYVILRELVSIIRYDFFYIFHIIMYLYVLSHCPGDTIVNSWKKLLLYLTYYVLFLLDGVTLLFLYPMNISILTLKHRFCYNLRISSNSEKKYI